VPLPARALGVAISSVFPALAPLFGGVCRPCCKFFWLARAFSRAAAGGPDPQSVIKMSGLRRFILFFGFAARPPGMRAAKHALLAFCVAAALLGRLYVFAPRVGRRHPLCGENISRCKEVC
jgi:hypothetical protein